MQILAGVVNPTSGNIFVEKPKNFVFQNPDHQVLFLCSYHLFVKKDPTFCLILFTIEANL